MKAQSLILAAVAAAPTVLAHTTWSVLYVDGVSQGDGTAIRMRMDPNTATFPVLDFSSDDMACNTNGTKGVNFVTPVKDGSTLTWEMRQWPNDASKGSLDRPHYGPCAVYMKKVNSAVEDKAVGDGWFKLMDDGYHADTGKWCTDRLIDNKGRLSVKLPKGLEGGYYLARPEVVALHNATNGAAQFYTGCSQIFLDSTGTLVPESTIAIPGPEYVTAGQSSVKFNIYAGKNAEYQVPGPAVANFTSKASIASTVQTKQTEGLIPTDCIAKNANWCGKEIPSYTDEQGCWASGDNCWTQGKACYDQAPPTGNSVCELWQAKCKAINDACTAKNFNGPPNKGTVLTPKAATIDVGLIIAPVGGGHVEESAPAPSSASQKPSSAASSVPAAFPSSGTPPKASFPPPKASVTPSASYSAGASSSTSSEPPALTSLPLLSFDGGMYAVPTSTSTKSAPPSSITASASAVAKAEDAACPEGFECITSYRNVVVTETRYVTVSA